MIILIILIIKNILKYFKIFNILLFLDWIVNSILLLNTFLSSLSLKKECFIFTLSNQISVDLISNTKTVNRIIQDTVILKFTISKDGKISLDELILDQNIIDLKKIIDLSFQNSIDKLPKIFPAIKRGQQVNVKFTLPIFVSTEEK